MADIAIPKSIIITYHLEKIMKEWIRFFAITAILGITSSNMAVAATAEQQCPVGLVNGLTLDQEFGLGAAEITRCLVKREGVKILFPLLRDCTDNAVPCTRPYALSSISNAIRDYEVTHGMASGTDFRVIAIAYSSGYKLVLKGNPFEQAVVDLLNKGVAIYLCQNTARTNNIKVQDMIAGVKFVTDCHTSISDFQSLGYRIAIP